MFFSVILAFGRHIKLFIKLHRNFRKSQLSSSVTDGRRRGIRLIRNTVFTLTIFHKMHFLPMLFHVVAYLHTFTGLYFFLVNALKDP